jgi:hypothetical protein
VDGALKLAADFSHSEVIQPNSENAGQPVNIFGIFILNPAACTTLIIGPGVDPEPVPPLEPVLRTYPKSPAAL